MLKRILVLLLVLSLNPALAAKKAELGDKVFVEYTGKLDTGAVFDSNTDEAKPDLEFVKY